MVSRDDRKRNKTLRRRLPILLKKAGELSILCGVPACLVAYCPGQAEPVVWPSPAVAADVVRRYRQQVNVPSLKNELAGKEFLVQKNDKVRAQLAKVQLRRHEEEIKLVIADSIAGRRGSFDDLSPDFLASVECKVQSKLKAIYARLQQIRSAPAQLPPAPPAPEYAQMAEQPLAMMLEPPPPQHDDPPPITFDGEPFDDSYLFEAFDPFNDAGHSSALPTSEDMNVIFLHAGICPPVLANPRVDP